MNIAHGASASFVARDSAQLATRVSQADCNTATPLTPSVARLIVWLPLTVIAFTGIAFAFPNLEKWYDNATPAQREFYLWSASEDAVSAAPDGRRALTFDEVADVVEARYPERAIDGVSPPLDETGTYSMWLTRGFSPWTREGSAGNVYLVVDQYSGETLYDGVPGEGNVFDQLWDDTTSRSTPVTSNVIRQGKRRRARARDAAEVVAA